MLKIQKKTKKIVIAAIAGCVCFFGVGMWQQPEQTDSVNMTAYEQFEGRVYDEERLEPMDMSVLLEQWQGRTRTDTFAKKDRHGWVNRMGVGAWGTRYYVDADSYVIGWQYLQKDGLWDWYYFAEDTGFLVKNTILDGVVLSKDGYAVSVSAMSEETLRRADQATHCAEVVVQDTIYVEDQITYSKDMKLIGGTKELVSIKEKAAASDVAFNGVLAVTNQAELTLAANIEVSTNGNPCNAVNVQDAGILHCYGMVGDADAKAANHGICATGGQTKVLIYPGATVAGADIGIYSQGETVLLGNDEGLPVDVEDIDKLQERAYGDATSGSFLRQARNMSSVQATTLNLVTTIKNNTDSGVVQDGGTLTMKGARIFNNGTLGGYGVTGSYGGGVRLKNGAIMDMTAGTIAGNAAVYGGGIYVDTGCTLNLQGGTIGGTKVYDSSAENTVSNGNYARENRISSNGYKYAYGGGGGIYSKGTINVTASTTTKIAYNGCEGSIGGGGVLIANGNAHFSGTVSIYSNKAFASAASSTSNLVGKDDINAEGAGIRIGTEDSGSAVTCTINCQNATDFPEVEGEVKIYSNTSAGDGGGIHVSSNTKNQLVVKGLTSIYSNLSQSDGGGAVKTNGGAIYLYGTELYSNSAINDMGGAILGAGVVDLETCTIYKNTAGKEGGGVAFFNSSQGVTGDGYLHGCMVYENKAGASGVGMAVMGGATGRVQGDSHIYNNGSNLPGIYCDTSSDLILSTGYIYGNGSYGVRNQGTTEVTGSTMIGFSTYESGTDFTASPNADGGFYNEGTLLVTNSRAFLVYGGDMFALKNAGGEVTFDDGSGSRFYGKDGTQVVWNQGTMTTVGKGFLFSPLIVISGDSVTYGLNNDGGTLVWRGDIKGSNRITETEIVSGNAGGLEYGLYNQNGGVVRMQEGNVTDNQTGIFNGAGSHLYLTGGVCQDSIEYGIYCETGSQFHMADAAAVDTSNAVFLEQDCYIDVNGALTATGVIAQLDTKENQDRIPGRIMVNVSYSGGTGAGELYDENKEPQFTLAYDTVDGGTPAFLLDGSQIQGVSDTVAATISSKDIYLSTVIEESSEADLTAWLYDRTAWLRNQMSGNKTDEQYQYFLAGDTGVITFACKNMSDVYIVWPSTGGADELASYDISGSQVINQRYVITELTDTIAEWYENSSYQFQVPQGTPEGMYYVTVVGTDLTGQEWNCKLPVIVGDKRISGTFRTRIR